MRMFLSCTLAACATCLGFDARAADPPAVASYIAYDLFELILEADVVVSGEIVELDEQNFVLKLERRIVGDTPEPSLRIQRFQDWTCAERWKHYAQGQRVVCFLAKPSEPAHPFRILGAADEGEMEVKVDQVRLGTGPLDGDSETPTAFSNTFEGRATVPVEQLDQAVRRLRAEVQWDLEKKTNWMQATNFRPRISLASLEAFAETSRLARNLCFEIRTSKSWEGALWSGPRSSPGYRIELRDLKTLETISSNHPSTVNVGDVDGDRVIDRATGHEGRDSRGSITIEFMNSDGTAASGLEITYGRNGFVGDVCEGEEFGRSLCAPGDIDGDGVPDLLVGSKTGVWTLLLASDGTVKRHKKLEDSPRDAEPAVHFGDQLAVLPRADAKQPLRIACAGTSGSGGEQVAAVWSLTLGSDGVLRPR